MLEREGWFEGTRAGAARGPPSRRRRPSRGVERHEQRDTAQTHIVFGTDTFPLRDPRRFALAILTNVFGGGMSSRLFQRVREELGLAYAIFAYKHFYQSSGQLGVYVGTQPGTADAAVEAIRGGVRPARPRRAAGRRAGATASSSSRARSCSRSRARAPAWAGWPASCCTTTTYRPLDQMLARDRRGHAPTMSPRSPREFFAPERQTVVRLGPER